MKKYMKVADESTKEKNELALAFKLEIEAELSEEEVETLYNKYYEFETVVKLKCYQRISKVDVKVDGKHYTIVVSIDNVEDPHDDGMDRGNYYPKQIAVRCKWDL